MGKDMDLDVNFKEKEGGRGKEREEEGWMTRGREEEWRQLMGWLSR